MVRITFFCVGFLMTLILQAEDPPKVPVQQRQEGGASVIRSRQDALYSNLRALLQKLESTAAKHPSDTVRYGRFPLQMRAEIRRLQEFYKTGKKTVSAHSNTKVAPKKVDGLSSKSTTKTAAQLESTISKTHLTVKPPDKSEPSLNDVPKKWVDKRCQHVLSVLDKTELIMSKPCVDAEELRKNLKELRDSVDGIAKPPKPTKADDQGGVDERRKEKVKEKDEKVEPDTEIK